MTDQELRELLALLEREGMNPQVCDTAVPFYENEVPAGIPTEPGDVVEGDYLLLPCSLVGLQPTFIVTVKGDSMRDAGIADGDRVQVQMNTRISDGDIVLADIGGACTVKAFCTDEQGQQWLVPRNETFRPILLTEDMNVRIIGKVVGHMTDAPRVSYRDCMKTIRQASETGREKERQVSRQQVEEAVRAAARQVKYGRQWYAAYRAMVDCKAVAADDYAGFVELLCEVVPEHGHLPRVVELQRVAVQSFSKPVVLWERGNAPVSGQRYDNYLRIARLVSEMLKTTP